jgi:hypothetical protein
MHWHPTNDYGLGSTGLRWQLRTSSAWALQSRNGNCGVIVFDGFMWEVLSSRFRSQTRDTFGRLKYCAQVLSVAALDGWHLWN